MLTFDFLSFLLGSDVTNVLKQRNEEMHWLWPPKKSKMTKQTRFAHPKRSGRSGTLSSGPPQVTCPLVGGNCILNIFPNMVFDIRVLNGSYAYFGSFCDREDKKAHACPHCREQ